MSTRLEPKIFATMKQVWVLEISCRFSCETDKIVSALLLILRTGEILRRGVYAGGIYII